LVEAKGYPFSKSPCLGPSGPMIDEKRCDLPAGGIRHPAVFDRLSAQRLLTTAIGVLAAWLAFVRLRWPLLGDATVFHLVAEQFSLGAVPYRDFIEMPLIYGIHAGIIAIGGMSDLTSVYSTSAPRSSSEHLQRRSSGRRDVGCC